MEELVQYNTRWDDLPTEIKIHCVKNMDFTTKTRLHSTSFDNQRIIDSLPRHHYRNVTLTRNFRRYLHDEFEIRTLDTWGNTEIVKTTENDVLEGENVTGRYDRFFGFFHAIICNCRIDELDIVKWQPRSQGLLVALAAIVRLPEIHVDTLRISPSESRTLHYLFLSKCHPSIQRLIFGGGRVGWFFHPPNEAFFELPQIKTAKVVEFSKALLPTESNAIIDSVRNWIRNGADVGNKLVINGMWNKLMDQILSDLDSYGSLLSFSTTSGCGSILMQNGRKRVELVYNELGDDTSCATFTVCELA